MNVFKDFYSNEVKLSFENHPFSKDPRHVCIICQYKNKWLLTKHKERGYEVTCGKVEHGETAKEAAIREVMEEEETLMKEITYLTRNYVEVKSDSVIQTEHFTIVD